MIKYRKMSESEIRKALGFVELVKKLGREKRHEDELRHIKEDMERGWRTQVGDPVSGVSL